MQWFISDTHWNHSNIVHYAKRPFEGVREHDETLIKNWNSKISPKDDVYHLGDFAFASPNWVLDLLNRLYGNIYLIKGNHDKFLRKITIRERFKFIENYYELKVPEIEQKVTLCHYPMLSWNKSHWGSLSLHGHTHSKTRISPENPNRINIAVDAWDYYPVSIKEILEEQKKLK